MRMLVPLLAAAGFWFVQWQSAPLVFVPAQDFTEGLRFDVYFVDADCYSRMTRVRRILENPAQPRINHHAFENHPDGVTPHTTAPLDYLIAGTAVGLSRVFRDPVDIAGALISPLLGTAGILFVGFYFVRRSTPFGMAAVVVYAFSPILLHGYALGRPDHQSLALLLVTIALIAELELWRKTSTTWVRIWALAWGAAMWVTLFEPLILFLLVVATRTALLRGRAWTPAWRAAWPLPVVLLAALAIEGWRFQPMPPETVEFFRNWSQSIGELQSPGVARVLSWTGWMLPLIPLALIRLMLQRRGEAALLLLLFVLMLALTLWHARWGYFLVLVFVCALPQCLEAIRWRWVAWVTFVISLWPLAAEVDERLDPASAGWAARAERLREAAHVRQAAAHLRDSGEQGGILAAWWLSPPLAYWSGQPALAGSSHQSLPGTTATARFFLAEELDAAMKILRERDVRWVVATNPEALVANSNEILGRADNGGFARQLFRAPSSAPPFLRLAFRNPHVTVYTFEDEGM